MIDPVRMIRPRRQILGISAILLPFQNDGAIDWDGFAAHVERTAACGLIPAINMDTGYANLIDEATRREVLARTRAALGDGPFVAGAFVGDVAGAPFQPDAYRRQIEAIREFTGIPVIFQSFGLTALSDAALVDAYGRFGESTPEFIAFELGTMFAPFGRIYSLDVYRQLLGIRACTGAKHSSLSRVLEWERLQLRDAVRPEFHVFTGNDLAVDMVMYGSDYLLGLSTFAPREFALRDRFWHEGDPRFYELNDLLQYLGTFAFRDPVPAYKHSAAQWLFLRGQIASPHTHPRSPTRPASDLDILRLIQRDLDRWLSQA